jgi:hypothetical protein
MLNAGIAVAVQVPGCHVPETNTQVLENKIDRFTCKSNKRREMFESCHQK